MWDFLTNLVNRLFDFLKSKNAFYAFIILLFVYGLVKLDEIKEILEGLKGIVE